MLQIRESTGTRIIFPSDKDDDKELIMIQGKKEGVEQAKAELLAAIAKMVFFCRYGDVIIFLCSIIFCIIILLIFYFFRLDFDTSKLAIL